MDQQKPPLEKIFDFHLARSLMNELNLVTPARIFTLGRGARGVLHIAPKKNFSDSSRFVRAAETTLCRGVRVPVEADPGAVPTCARCKEVAERIIVRKAKTRLGRP